MTIWTLALVWLSTGCVPDETGYGRDPIPPDVSVPPDATTEDDLDPSATAEPDADGAPPSAGGAAPGESVYYSSETALGSTIQPVAILGLSGTLPGDTVLEAENVTAGADPVGAILTGDGGFLVTVYGRTDDEVWLTGDLSSWLVVLAEGTADFDGMAEATLADDGLTALFVAGDPGEALLEADASRYPGIDLLIWNDVTGVSALVASGASGTLPATSGDDLCVAPVSGDRAGSHLCETFRE